MNLEEYNKWCEVALIVAQKAFDITEGRRERLIGAVSGVLDHYNHFYHSLGDPDRYGYEDVHSFDHSENNVSYVCDYVDDYYYDYWFDGRWEPGQEHKFLALLRMAIRIGIDAALPDSGDAGVLGFTLGEIKQWYDGEIPDWLATEDWWYGPLKYRSRASWHYTVHELDDDAGLWLT